MDAKLLGKLTRAEEDLLSAMVARDGELAAFDFSWTSLLDEISQASALGDISNTTLAVADDVVARVSTLVECCLSLSSAHSPSPPVLNLNTSPPSPFHATTFIPEAYSWLLENIANPYPSSEFKASLAQRYNSPVSAVSSWFANARRRMGWTALCRDFFCNCRADTVDAAYRVLVKGHSNHRLGPEVTHAFVTMKVTAEELYATSKKSALAGDLDAVVKDMPAEDGILAGDDGRGETIGHSKELEEYRRKQPAHMRNTWQKDSMTRICYPSSEPSHSSSPAPSPDDSLTDESEEDTLPPSLAGRKRCLLPSEPAQVAGSRATTRPAKRPRISSSSPDARLSSLSTSTEEPFSNDPSDQAPRVPGNRDCANINPHGRCLSDANANRSPKHSQDSLHAVSDPLPLSTLESERSVDEWFKTNFDDLFAFPPPVDVTVPDHSTLWEVELFNNCIISEHLQKSFPPPIQLSSSTDLAVFEDLLQSLEHGGFAPPPETTNPSTTAVLDPVSHGLSLLPDFSETIDWTTLLNEDPSEPICEPMFSQSCFNSTPPEINLSILQLPQIWTAVAS